MDTLLKSYVSFFGVAEDMKNLIPLLLTITLLSCSDNKVDLSKVDDREFAEFLMVMESKCLDCHDNYNNTDQKYWIKEGLVVEGQPKKSPLFRTIRGADVSGTESMPPLKSAQVTEEEIDKIKAWINKLANYQETNKKLVISYNKDNKLSPREKFERCYKQMTMSPLTDSVKIKTCEELLDQIQYDSGTTVTNPLRKSILRTFQFVHSNWSNEFNFYTKSENWGTYEIFDQAQNAYAFTHNLFSKDSKLKDLFKGDQNYIAKRISHVKSDFLVLKQDGRDYQPMNRFKWILGNDDQDLREWKGVSRVTKGELVGVEKQPRNINKIYEIYKDIHERDKNVVNVDINKGFGGGVLGSPSFVTLTFGNDNLRYMDGERHTMRTWSKNIFKDFMCRSLPVLELHDTYKYVDKKSHLSFQKNNTCMNCHASIDPMAGAMRNVTLGFNNIIADKVDLRSNRMGHLQSSIPIDVVSNPQLEGVTEYAKAQRSGTLRYRNFKGELIEKSFVGPDELGQILMNQVDPYICMSKRYLEYFTGVKIDLDNLVKNRTFHTAEERYYYELLIELGLKLKESQNLKSLIKDIIDHPIYSQRNYKVNVSYEGARD
jgi:hypothetical protein